MKSSGLQEQFLNAIRKQSIPAAFYLVNGFLMKGVLKAFDDYTLVLESDGAQKLVFKHAVSTIIPSQTVDLVALNETGE